MSRKETIRPGLEIDFDLLDSDLLRCCIPAGFAWAEGPTPVLVWTDYVDQPGRADIEQRVMTRTLDNEQELAEGRRRIRLENYKSYADLADLARRPPEEGAFVIRKPPFVGHIRYVRSLDEAALPPGFGDPDLLDPDLSNVGVQETLKVEEAQRFPHTEAIRLTIRIMEVLGRDIPGNLGKYWEPVRADIAEELHARAARRPRSADALYAMLNDLSREP